MNNTENTGHFDKIILFFSTGFGSGYFPVAPGTAGTVVGILVYLAMRHLSPTAYISITFLISIIGIYISTESERILSKIDPKEVVIDEIAGILLSLFLLPIRTNIIVAGFIIFRILDISKPFGFLEKLPGGWGIMFDDIAAGVATNLIIQLLLAYNLLII